MWIMRDILIKILLLALLFAMSSCVTEEQDDLDCASGQTYDSVLRQCSSNSSTNNKSPFPHGDQTINATEKASSPFYYDFAVSPGTDADGNSLNYIVVSNPAYGTITNCMNQSPDGPQPDLTCRYTPTDADFSGVDQFVYRVNDGYANSSINATVTINIAAVNDAPTITVDTVTSGVASGLGTVGSPYIYNLNEGDSATIVASIDEGGFTDEDSQSITSTLSAIGGANASGLAQSDFSHSYGLLVGGGASAFAFSDSILSADTNNHSLSFTLPAGALGAADTITFSVDYSDGVATSTIYFQINVTNINNVPIFASTSTQTAANAFVEGAAQSSLNSGNLTTATDPEAAATVVYEVVSAPTGTLVDCMDRDGTGSVVAATTDVDCDYIASTTEIVGGIDSFTYRACETTAGTNCSSAITVNINFSNANDEPTIATGAQAFGPVSEKKSVSDPVLNFSAAAGSDEEDSSSSLVYEIISKPNTSTEGVLRDCMDLDSSGAATGTKTSDLDCVFDPVVGYSGVASFTYRVCDTSGACSDDTTGTNIGTGNMTVTAIDDPPTISAVADQTFNEGASSISIDYTLDEGDGSAEDSQQLLVRVTVASVDNPLLLPEANITVTPRDGSAFTADTDDAFTTTFDASGSNDASDTSLNLLISPVVGETGTVTITVEVSDGVNATVSDSFNLTISPYSALHGGWSNIAAQGDFQTSNGTTISLGDGYVYLEWNTMTVAGGTNVASWNVYRDIDSDGDGIGDNGTLNITSTPIATGISSSQLYYTDTDDDSSNDLTAGQVYLYKIRPVAAANSLPMEVSESYSTVRVIYPQPNWSFIHRWIINKENCEDLGLTSVPTQDFGCAYVGPNAVDIGGGTYYFKQANDVLAMTFEAGCNYSRAPNCTSSGCIGSANPNSAGYDVSNGAMYYNRDTSVCYVQTAAATWTAINSITMASQLAGNSLNPTPIYNPPIANISRDQASAYCQNMTAPSLTGASASASPDLPSKLLYNAMSDWDDSLTDTNINSFESGSALNSSSKCNTYDANGISFVDSEVPTSSFADTLPALASATSLSRALRTGSDTTAACISRFGMQDLIGNMAEWISEDIACAADDSCTTTFNGNGVSGHDYNFDGTDLGPCADSATTDDVCDGTLSSWTIANALNDATKFFTSMGLPADAETGAGFSALTIGTGTGEFSQTKLHSDTIIINADLINAGSGTGEMSVGGSYATGGNAAGRFHLEAVEDGGTLNVREDIGFRCSFEVTYP